MSVSMNPGATTFTVMLRDADLARQRLAEADQPGLRRRVVGLAGVAHLADHRADGDDPAAALLQHRLQRRLAEGEGRGQVGGDDLVPVGALHAQHQLVAGDAGVADQDVEAAVAGDDVGDDRRGGGAVGHVEGHGLGAAARGRDLVDRGLRVGAARRRRPPARRAPPARSRSSRPMPREAPVTSATCPSKVVMNARSSAARRRPTRASTAARPAGWSRLTMAASRATFRMSPLSTVPGPTST